MIIEELDQEIQQNRKAEPMADEIESLMTKKEPMEDELTDLMTKRIDKIKIDEKRIDQLQDEITAIDTLISQLVFHGLFFCH